MDHSVIPPHIDHSTAVAVLVHKGGIRPVLINQMIAFCRPCHSSRGGIDDVSQPPCYIFQVFIMPQIFVGRDIGGIVIYIKICRVNGHLPQPEICLVFPSDIIDNLGNLVFRVCFFFFIRRTCNFIDGKIIVYRIPVCWRECRLGPIRALFKSDDFRTMIHNTVIVKVVPCKYIALNI